MTNGKNRAQRIRRTQNGSAIRLPNSHGQKGFTTTSRGVRNLNAGIHGENRQRLNHHQQIVGGIISQLIEDVAEQLAEAKESITKLEKTLESLKQAQTLLQEPEPPESDN